MSSTRTRQRPGAALRRAALEAHAIAKSLSPAEALAWLIHDFASAAGIVAFAAPLLDSASSHAHQRQLAERTPVGRALLRYEFRGRCTGPNGSSLNHGGCLEPIGGGLYGLLEEHLRGARDLVELGCGYGRGAAMLAHRLGARVTGVDICLGHVRFARARERGANVRFRWNDAANLEVPDGSVDAVLAVESIHGIVDRAAIVHEAARVLRAGGRFVVADIDRVEGPGLEELVRTAGFRVLAAYSIADRVASSLDRCIDAIDRADAAAYWGDITMGLARAVDRPRFELLASAYRAHRLDYRVLVASPR